MRATASRCGPDDDISLRHAIVSDFTVRIGVTCTGQKYITLSRDTQWFRYNHHVEHQKPSVPRENMDVVRQALGTRRLRQVSQT